MRKLRKFSKYFDMFSALPTFRVDEEPELSSYFSGAISIVATLFFTYVFIINTIEVFTYLKIQSTETESVPQ